MMKLIPIQDLLTGERRFINSDYIVEFNQKRNEAGVKIYQIILANGVIATTTRKKWNTIQRELKE